MAQSDAMTVLCTDLVRVNRSGPASEDLEDRLFRTHHKLLCDAVEASGGHELQWLGNGMLAGFESTSEAVQCAISIQQTLRRPAEGVRLEIRIGVHFGEARQRGGAYFGPAVSLVRQLCEAAEAGQILCSGTVEELLRSRQRFSFREPVDRDGSALPAAAREVLYEANDAAAMLSRTPFVGRSVQLRRLQARLDEASHGRGSIAMLRGEPGIGKSRLLEEFADVAMHSGAIVLRGACYDGEWQQPFGAFAEAILEYVRHASHVELVGALGTRAAILSRIVPALRDVIADIPEPPELDSEDQRFRLFDAVAQFLISISRTATLVLILDDLHWADRGVIGMLNHVAHFALAHPLLVVGAYRDAEVTRQHPLTGALAAIGRSRNFESLALDGLTGAEVGDLLELVGNEAPPAELIGALTDATEGNPLFIREVLMHLVEEGKILSEGRGWISRFSVEQLAIPEGVRQIIDRRLERLSPAANTLLSSASAFNGSFPFEVTAAAAALDETTALAAIDEALEAQLIRPASHADHFDFTHALIRQSLYTKLNGARRTRLHRKIAEEMERIWGEQTREHAAEVAFHFWHGSGSAGTQRGAEYAIAAADNAAAAYAHDDAAEFLRIALELLTPSDPRRSFLLQRMSFALTWSLNADEALKTAHEAGALIVANDGPGAGADYFEQIARTMYNAGLTAAAWDLAREGLRHIGDRRDITWASLKEVDLSREESQDPGNPGVILDSAAGREVREALKSLPREQLDARQIEPIHFTRLDILADPHPTPRALMRTGDYRKAARLWQQVAVDSEQRGAIVHAIRGWAGMGRCHNALGDFAQGRAALDRASALSARIGILSFGLISYLGAHLEYRFVIDDGFADFLALARNSMSYDDSADVNKMLQGFGTSNKWAVASAYSYLACMFAHLGQRELALARLPALIDAIQRGAGWSLDYALMACMTASTVWLLDHREHANLMEHNIFEKMVRPDYHFPFCDGRLSLARLCSLQGRYDEAIEWFAKARVVLEENGSRPLRALTDFDEATMYLRRRQDADVARAQPLLASAMNRFVSLGMTGWARRARAAQQTA
ncbi:MAG TPA: AAA family ATPase [Candidatus Binataceae bacterium]|nr:AAA family ATPase [Candidatus Binataceae bacterium]